MRYLTLTEVLEIHRRVIEQYGGRTGVHSMAALESSIAQPRMTFGGEDLYPTIIEKASALGFSIISNHPFIDGNKRVGHAAMEIFLVLNGYEIGATVDEQEKIILKVAASEMDREEFSDWPRNNIIEKVR